MTRNVMTKHLLWEQKYTKTYFSRIIQWMSFYWMKRKSIDVCFTNKKKWNFKTLIVCSRTNAPASHKFKPQRMNYVAWNFVHICMDGCMHACRVEKKCLAIFQKILQLLLCLCIYCPHFPWKVHSYIHERHWRKCWNLINHFFV